MSQQHGSGRRSALSNRLASARDRLGRLLGRAASADPRLSEIRDLLMLQLAERARSDHPNPLVRAGRKCFSQADEDGITLEILRRIGALERGAYAEFGVGDGSENNTLILAALGWRGFWVGGEELCFKAPDRQSRFAFLKRWITLDNIVDLARSGLQSIGADQLDVISLDLDGNDIYLVEALLAGGFKPKLFIVEYNAMFPPPVRFQIAYDPAHVWRYDNYFGASLTSFDDLFRAFGYRLVCCNAQTGANAFFVRDEFADSFHDVPTELAQLYVEPRYFLIERQRHPSSPRTIERILAGD